MDQKRGSYVVEVCNMQNVLGLVLETGVSERIDILCLKIFFLQTIVYGKYQGWYYQAAVI